MNKFTKMFEIFYRWHRGDDILCRQKCK